MRKSLILGLSAAAILVSCSKRDEQFCKCMEAGDKLNQFSNELLERGANKEDETKIIKLRAEKDSACVSFYTMGGEEMLEKKKDCGYE